MDVTVSSLPAWTIGPLGLVVWFFLRDAYNRIQASIEKKADQDATIAALAQHKSDLTAMESRHGDEVARIERQYAEWRASIVQQFSDRMGAMEVRLIGQIDMVIKLIEKGNDK